MLALPPEPASRDMSEVHLAGVPVVHVVPVRVRPDLAFDGANLQPLCRICQHMKAAAARGAASPRDWMHWNYRDTLARAAPSRTVAGRTPSTQLPVGADVGQDLVDGGDDGVGRGGGGA